MKDKQDKPLAERIFDKIAYAVLTIMIILLAMYPIAAITGWQYHLDIGFTLWREP